MRFLLRRIMLHEKVRNWIREQPEYSEYTVKTITLEELDALTEVFGVSLQEADLRRKFGLNIIAIERGEQTMTDINPAHVFAVDDIIVVVGKNESIQRFEEHLV